MADHGNNNPGNFANRYVTSSTFDSYATSTNHF